MTKQRFVTSALYNWWIPQSLGINFTDGRAKLNTIEIIFDNAGTSAPAVEVDLEYKKGYASKATLTINSDLLYKMTEKNFDGTLPKESCVDSDTYDNEVNYTNYLDRLILTALTEVALAANIPYVDELPDGVTYNADKTALIVSEEFEGKDILNLANFAGTGNDNLNGGSVTLKEFTAQTFHVNDDAYTLNDSKFVKK